LKFGGGGVCCGGVCGVCVVGGGGGGCGGYGGGGGVGGKKCSVFLLVFCLLYTGCSRRKGQYSLIVGSVVAVPLTGHQDLLT